MQMAEDNTPTVSSRRRRPTRHMRLRIETLKRLRALGAQRRASKEKNAGVSPTTDLTKATIQPGPARAAVIEPRAPKVKTGHLCTAPVPKGKFRKRQIDKTWLPTHMFHAKRARMTSPKEPLWRFAIPMTPTAKSYRPTHSATHERGAVAWDMSYMSTIGLSGPQKSIEGVFKALGIGAFASDAGLWSSKGQNWRDGSRTWQGFVLERETPRNPIAPVTVIWSSINGASQPVYPDCDKRKRHAFIRVHPSAFAQLWTECVRLGKVAKPQISVEDLRFEIGSLEVNGPNATEALLGALKPLAEDIAQREGGNTGRAWTRLAGLMDPGLLPANVILAFEIQDPRLHHPPQTIIVPQNASEQQALVELTATWAVDSSQISPALFDRGLRMKACTALPSQKSINRRKSAAMPGEYPEPMSTDPKVPALVYSVSAGRRQASSWTVLLPWKCVQPAWYSLMYCPLSTGGQPRFGGLDEKRQIMFETSQPWFPGDFPGTKAGLDWELQQRQKRKDEWMRRPKSKRIKWDIVETGNFEPGEVGDGWSCDWERLLSGPISTNIAVVNEPSTDSSQEPTREDGSAAQPTQQGAPATPRPKLSHVPLASAREALKASMDVDMAANVTNPVINISLKSLTKGVPQTCARIYRLPSVDTCADLRREWLALHPRNVSRQKGRKTSLPRLPKDAPAHVVQRRLAQSLLERPQAGDSNYPSCPPEEDLIGFVTTGNLNLSEGRGSAVGNILLNRVMQDVRENGKDGRLCVVRNAGNSIGRLAEWELA